MNSEKIFKTIITLAIVALALFLVWRLWSIVLYVIVAAILSLVGRPLVVRLTRVNVSGVKLSRSVAAALTLVLMWIVVGGLGWLFLPLIFGKVSQLAVIDWDGVITHMESSFADVRDMLQRHLSIELNDMGVAFKEFVLGLIDVDFVKTFGSVVSVVKSMGIALFSVSFITYYFMRDDGLFYKLVTLFFPDRYRSNVHHALDSITSLLSRYFGGLMVESLLLMVIISVIMLIVGMPLSDALIIGLIMGIFNVIPYAGPVIGAFLSLCVAIITPIDGNMVYTVVAIVSTIVSVKVVDDFIIQPTIYSDRVQAHPLEIFLCILVAGTVAGVWGMLLAIPLYTVLRVFAREFFSEYSLVRKLTSQMTE